MQINDWKIFLSATEPVNFDTPHAWICQTKRNGGEKKIEVLTSQQYREFFNQHSHWNSSLKKLSFLEIVQFTNHVFESVSESHNFGNYKQKVSPGFDAVISIRNIVNADVFPTDIVQQIENIYAAAQKKMALLQSMLDSLQKMSDRARHNRVIRKEQRYEGLIGKIKSFCAKLDWLIWAWFHDKTEAIKILKSKVHSIEYIRQEGCDAIQDRILLNMGYFVEEIGQAVTYSDEEYQNPSDVRKKWLIKYAEDKMPVVNERAKEFRQRILILLKLWEGLIKKEETKGATAPIFNPQQQLAID